MTETTDTQPAQPQRVQVDPLAMLNEARALNDFLTNRSIQHVNEILILTREKEALVKQLEDQAKEFALEKTRLEQERDQMVQRLEAANAKIIEIQSAQTATLISKTKVKANG